MSIEVKNISKSFGDFHALKDVSLNVNSGELIALLGPSGCGKTTLLRIIAGLESSDSGAVLFSGHDTTHVHVRDRQVGFVFQHYALFRHMSVFDNVAFGLNVKPRSERPSKAQIKEKVMSLLKLVQLDWLADRFPAQLSGGQRQRIALARALAVEPQVLLLDEPFGALDAKVRKELRRWLRRLHEELHVTSIFVTHDQEEALEVADRVVVMNKGRIEQVGSPQQVWNDPASPFVYGFLGDVNLFKGRAEKGSVSLQGFELQTDDQNQTGDAFAYVRPHELDVLPYTPGAEIGHNGKSNGLIARIDRAIVVGPVARLELLSTNASKGADNTTVAATLIEAHIAADRFAELGLREGDTVLVTPRRARVFVEGTTT
ncbi:sulfate ABC transporter ATP-binding protein [Lampropedia aestuarii]|uniref:Sulfate ABC transporter ATP-binding protein n=1 Tax=Lampropedia aestuarii TaxID=2562762 RepID=A0A4S5BH84_9BURK|nr:sulfate ABC transporter ATP-binding protein [Lampropedia aestuarii]MDH5858302.1 sulfate ABC transporter ATP-binding protein [Lampropedia aestuarii]THJ31449.1 sulfate ABC transporter ATP-binding protein [Lampropedia aestuarii]